MASLSAQTMWARLQWLSPALLAIAGACLTLAEARAHCSGAAAGSCVDNADDETAQAQLRTQTWFGPASLATSEAASLARSAENLKDPLKGTGSLELIDSDGLDDRQRPDAWARTRAVPPKGSRIAIIGAGPAGLHMASQLKKLGYDRVTLFEKSDRIGGHAFSVYLNSKGEPCRQDRNAGKVDTECIAYELGEGAIHHNFRLARALNKHYGLQAPVSQGTTAVRSNMSAATIDVGMDEFLLRVVEDGIARKSLTPPTWLRAISRPLTAMYLFMEEAQRYCRLHRSLLRDVSMSLSWPPTDEALSQLTVSLKEFLKGNNFVLLEDMFVFLLPSKWYGHMDKLPAYYGLLWATPELLNGVVQQIWNSVWESMLDLNQWSPAALQAVTRYSVGFLLGVDAGKVEVDKQVLPEGWEKLWQAMHEQDALDVRFNVEIAHHGIKRDLLKPDSPVTVTFFQPGRAKAIMEFDMLMYTAPHAFAARFVSDLTPWEQRIFSDLAASVSVTTLYRSGPVPGYSTSQAGATEYVAKETRDGGWCGDRYPRAIFPSASPDTARQVRLAYQHFEEPCRPDVREGLCNIDTVLSTSSPFSKTLPTQAKELSKAVEAAGGKTVEVVGQLKWNNWRFSKQGLKARFPWLLYSMQGVAKTYWLGVGAISESMHDVMNYNCLILRRDFGAVIDADGMVVAQTSPPPTSPSTAPPTSPQNNNTVSNTTS